MRLIDADELVIMEYGGIKFVPKEFIDDAPTIEERKTGRWIRIGRRLFKCDQCKKILDFNGVNVGRGSANYCPNCGCRMMEVFDNERSD